ncbi:MAG: hypothetical protein ABIJ97_06200, partial [Bacteroidota bacterium]
MLKLKLFILITLIFFIKYNYAQQWINSTSTNFYINGGVSTISCLYTDNNKLYLGGGFGDVGGNVAHSIAAWDSLNWYVFGGGMPSGGISSMKIFNDKLYAGGSFLNAEGILYRDYLAFWNDTSWNKVGDQANINDAVMAMEEYQGKLFVGGTFSGFGSTYWTHP